MFHHLGYPSSLVNCIIDKCDYSSTLDAKTKSDDTLRVSILFKDQISAKGKCAISLQKSALMYNQSTPVRNLSRT